MLLVLPLVAFYGWVRLLRVSAPRLRQRLPIAAVWWTLCLIVITEILSAFHALHTVPVAVAWAVTAICAFVCDFVMERRRRQAGSRAAVSAGPGRETLHKADWFLFGCCLAILTGTAITALVAPPNGWDVTLQHMPRVMEWLAQGSIGLFPTNYYVQDFAPPLTEWIMLHSVLLAGSDRFVNLVQWLASAGSALAVGLIAEEFGCAIRGQLIAALLCLTIPQGVLSASGAKNDWVVAFWLCLAVLLILQWQRSPRWFTAVTLGIALGALILTKGTAYAFGPPVGIALLFVTPRAARRKLPAAVLLAASIMVLINVPQWRQNYRLDHSIFGLPTPDIEGRLKYTADRITPATAAANVLRETSLHFGSPVGSINRHNTVIVGKAIHALGINPDDPGLIRPGPAYAIPAYSLDEYLAGNPLHLLLIVVAFGFALSAIRNMPREAALAIGIVAAFVLYCAVFKWEIWAARLHLALFVVACPIIAAMLYRRYAKPIYILAIVLFVVAIPDLLFNSIRPLVSSNGIRALMHRQPDPLAYSILFRARGEMYFGESVDLEPTYLPAGRAARAVACRHIGLDTTNHPIAYGYILMGIIDNGGAPRRFRYVGVSDRTAPFTSRIDAQPVCAVICIRCLHDAAKMAKYSSELPKIQSFGTLVLFSQSTQ